MSDQIQNFVKLTVNGGHDADDVEINVVDASLAPDPESGEYNPAWYNATDYPDPADDPNKEIVRVTGRDTLNNKLTVTRAQEGTPATTKNTAGATYKLVLGPTKKVMDEKADKANVLELDNETAFTPDADYEPATKKYVDDNSGGGGGEGILVNGKIVPSVASNNLTVAIKTLAGEDPSEEDPVQIQINGIIHSIIAPLQVTVNAGANTFNAGSAELATKEIDYFAYLGYNATDGVVLGISRYPGACSYDDFSTTATNEKYCAISTITNAAATDYYVNIGRFAATLSAGAGYTWTVPTFTAKNLIQRPIYDVRGTTPIMPSFNSRLASKVITFTRDLAAVSGDVSYTGVGFMPTAMIAFATIPEFMGVVDSGKVGKEKDIYTDTKTQVDTSDFIRLNPASGAQQSAVVKSFDSDGFTLTWTKAGSPTGTLTIIVMCFR